MVNALKRLIVAWERTQVELHGQYSLQRLRDLHTHTHTISEWENALVYLLTPLPCLVPVLLLDCLKLDPPENGVPTSAGFWVRMFGVFAVLSVAQLSQIQGTVPALSLDTPKIVVITLLISSVGVASHIGWALLIKFPVPFSLPLVSPELVVAFVAGVWVCCADVLRGNAEIQRDVKGYVMVVGCQLSLSLVYPMYAYVFALLSSYSQATFVLLLPCIKIVAKNAINHVLGDLDDLKPELVIFNVEVFHALYISLCMGMSTSILTTVALMVVDFVQAWLSLNDMKELVRDLNRLLDKMSPPTKQPEQVITTKLGLNALERLEFVQKATKVLYMIEYAVLIEFTEVAAPLIYSIYILFMYYLPNRAYYPQLAELSDAELFRNLRSVLLYASLELLSFLAMGFVIKRQLGIARTRQLTFVLQTQWRMVQGKLAFWVMYISQTYLYHLGADFSFQFKWLSQASPTPSQ